MLKRDAHLRTGNDRFEGFAVDLLQRVADMLHFDFEIYLVHDGKFGSRLENGEWNGLIGELLAGVRCGVFVCLLLFWGVILIGWFFVCFLIRVLHQVCWCR